MKYTTGTQKSARQLDHDWRLDASAGPRGMAINPPTYNMDVVDRMNDVVTPAQTVDNAQSDSHIIAAQGQAIQRVVNTSCVGNYDGAPPSVNRTGLPDNLKAGIENLSGISMDDVKVHYHSAKPAQLNALAYTQGTDIHVGPGQEKYLPHEGWHVVQQMEGRVTPTVQSKGVSINDDEGLEQEADVMGAKASQIRNSDQVDTGPIIQSVPARLRDGEDIRVSEKGMRSDLLFSRPELQMKRAEPSGVIPVQLEIRKRGSESSGTYIIEVRARPVTGLGGLVATHTFIVLLDGSKVIDSLSFDPSNSVNGSDADPTNDVRGNVVIGQQISTAMWRELVRAFNRRTPYNLHTNNCTHAVADALIATNFEGATGGIALARNANQTWDAVHRRLSAPATMRKNL